MSKRYREVLEEVETPASRRAADPDVAGPADVAGSPPPPDGRAPRQEGDTGGSGGGVATLVRPPATATRDEHDEHLDRVRRTHRPTRPGNGPVDADEPLAFTWRGRHYAVTRILGHWREEEGWWRRPDGEPIRIEQSDLWRVEAFRDQGTGPAGNGHAVDRHGVYELARRGTTWRLDRVWD